MENNMNDNPKEAIGLTKPSLNAVPMAAVYVMGEAMSDGHLKYGPFNWRGHAVRSDVYVDAARRHLEAWNDGENVAEDSKVHHLGHVMACCAILIDAELNGKLIDNRSEFGGCLSEYFKKNTKGKI